MSIDTRTGIPRQKEMYRQGDLLFVMVSNLPTDVNPTSTELATGEATGARNKHKINEIEKMALSYIASDQRLSDARQITGFVTRGIRRMPEREDRMKYDHLFDAGEQDRGVYWEKIRITSPDFVNSFINISV